MKGKGKGLSVRGRAVEGKWEVEFSHNRLRFTGSGRSADGRADPPKVIIGEATSKGRFHSRWCAFPRPARIEPDPELGKLRSERDLLVRRSEVLLGRLRELQGQLSELRGQRDELHKDRIRLRRELQDQLSELRGQRDELHEDRIRLISELRRSQSNPPARPVSVPVLKGMQGRLPSDDDTDDSYRGLEFPGTPRGRLARFLGLYNRSLKIAIRQAYPEAGFRQIMSGEKDYCDGNPYKIMVFRLNIVRHAIEAKAR